MRVRLGEEGMGQFQCSASGRVAERVTNKPQSLGTTLRQALLSK